MKVREKRILILILIFTMIIVSACGTNDLAHTKDDSINQAKEKDKDKMEERDYNDFSFRNVPPDDLPKDWESMQFIYATEKFDLIGQKLKVFDSKIKKKVYNDAKTLKAGNKTDVGVIFFSGGSENFFPMTLRVQNLTDTEIPIEKAVIVSVGLSDSGPEKKSLNKYKPNVREGFILPMGIAPYDPFSKVEELYGKPDEEGDVLSGIGKYKLYLSKDGEKYIAIRSFNTHVQSFVMAKKITPYYLKELENKKSINDFTDKLTENSYININGHKVKLSSKLKDSYNALKLDYNVFRLGEENNPNKINLKAKSEYDFSAKIPGYDNYSITFRLFNKNKEQIKAIDSTIVGIKISKNNNQRKSYVTYMDLPDPDYGLPEDNADYLVSAIGPYGIKIGDETKKGFNKLPDNATEKELTKDGGGIFSNDVGNVQMKVFSYPQKDENVINEILLTLKKF